MLAATAMAAEPAETPVLTRPPEPAVATVTAADTRSQEDKEVSGIVKTPYEAFFGYKVSGNAKREFVESKHFDNLTIDDLVLSVIQTHCCSKGKALENKTKTDIEELGDAREPLLIYFESIAFSLLQPVFPLSSYVSNAMLGSYYRNMKACLVVYRDLFFPAETASPAETAVAAISRVSDQCPLIRRYVAYEMLETVCYHDFAVKAHYEQLETVKKRAKTKLHHEIFELFNNNDAADSASDLFRPYLERSEEVIRECFEYLLKETAKNRTFV